MAKFNSDNFKLSSKRLQIDKSNTKVLIYISLAVVALVFALVASFSLWKQIQYQNKVLSLRNKAVDQLEKNKKATAQLQAQYVAFDTASESIIGNSDPNSKVVLNALPSKYDFPALITSIDNLAQKTPGIALDALGGTDEQLTAEQSSADPKPVEIPLTLSGQGSYDSVKQFIKNIERTTRPIKVKTISISGGEGSMKTDVVAATQYQPLKILQIQKQKVSSGSSKATTKQTNTQKAAK